MKQRTQLQRVIFDRLLVQKDIAKAVGLDPADLSRIVNGKLQCSQAGQVAIAAHLKLPLAELFSPDGFAIAASEPGRVAA